MSENKEEEKWQSLLINGRSRVIKVKNPVFEDGVLKVIEDLKPFDKTGEKGAAKPEVKDANEVKRMYYTEFFRKPFKNLLVLSGAGSSMGSGGKSMTELWAIAKKEFDQKEANLFGSLLTAVSHKGSHNLETLLSVIDGVIEFAGNKEFGEMKLTLSETQKTIFELIQRECNLSSPKDDFPHAVFLKKILQRKLTDNRVKVFTLNYDLLFEKAANDINAVIIDGFSFSTPRVFSGRFFDYDIVQREGSKLKDEDNFVPRVFHLHKIHGSLNWKRENNQVVIEEHTKNPLMIFPREAKYKDSYEQPYFEMMARFQRNLRSEHDTLLVCIGYSFQDMHVNAAIEEALNQNPAFRLAIIDPYFDYSKVKALERIKNEAVSSERVLLVSETFLDFANNYPEIKTYDTESTLNSISLRNDEPKKD